MNTTARLAPTRMNLLRARRQLRRVQQGADLLRRKREALVAELFRAARPALDARAAIADRLRQAYPDLLDALARHGHAGLRALGTPERDLALEVVPTRIWGIPVAEIARRPETRRSVRSRGVNPGAAGPAATETAVRFEILTELLIDAAPRELRVRRLGDALAQTSRLLHALEQRVAPALARAIDTLRQTLDEREREERVRLRHLRRARGNRSPTTRTDRDRAGQLAPPA